jgi:hypothetical protein
MLFKSPVFSQASGSIGGTTFSHNRGGMYTRNRVVPTDPSSSRQQAIRAAMGVLAPYWSLTLGEADRALWNDYAANVAMTNRLGDTVYLTGQQHFLRANIPRLQAGIGVLAAAPINYNLGTFTPPTLGNVEASLEFLVNFTNTDDWAIAVGGYLLIYTGQMKSPGVGFYRGPWRYTTKVAGAVVPPTSPEDILGSEGWELSTGSKTWVQCRIIQVDGRLSLPIILGPAIVA